MAHPADRAAGFLALHHGDVPLLIPNPWDPGSARLLASMGFAALATTSSGFAATLGRLDGSVSLDEALDHAAAIVSSVDVPVSADLENGFADDPTGVAETVRRALATGLAGCSIEDATQRPDDPIYAHDLAVERVAAAVEVAHGTATRMVITARAENHLHGRDDLVDTIRRLQAFGAAGADVLYAPGLIDKAAIAAVVSAVEQPVNVLLLPGGPSVGELADLGVRRMSIGGGLAYAALGAVVAAANELLESGTVGFYRGASVGRAAAKAAFG